MLTEQDIWKLMARSLFGEATPEEQGKLQSFLTDNPELQQQFDLLSQTLKTTPVASNPENKNAQKLSSLHIIEKANQASKHVYRTHFKRKVLLVAASVLLIVATGWFWLFRQGSPLKAAEKPAFAVQYGERKQIVLPDGTKVWLNGGSNLFYITNFNGATREVKLEGEAFFDVVKKQDQPFIVHAGELDIKVLGTAFNVKAYKEDDKVETTLYRGLVNISKQSDITFQPIMLYPNQKIIVPLKVTAPVEKISVASSNSAIKKSIAVQLIDSTKIESLRMETAWMYNRLEFRGDQFPDLANKLERWYNVKIVFEDEKVKQLSFNGSFEKESIEQALLALATANLFNYKIENNEIFIRSAK